MTDKNVFPIAALHIHVKRKNSLIIRATFVLLRHASQKDRVEKKKKRKIDRRRIVGYR